MTLKTQGLRDPTKDSMLHQERDRDRKRDVVRGKRKKGYVKEIKLVVMNQCIIVKTLFLRKKTRRYENLIISDKTTKDKENV